MTAGAQLGIDLTANSAKFVSEFGKIQAARIAMQRRSAWRGDAFTPRRASQNGGRSPCGRQRVSRAMPLMGPPRSAAGAACLASVWAKCGAGLYPAASSRAKFFLGEM